MLTPGLYEQVINKLIQDELDRVEADMFHIDDGKIDEAESPAILAQYLSAVIKSALAAVRHEDKLDRRIEVCNQLVQLLANEVGEPYLKNYLIGTEAKLLLALLDSRRTAAAAVTRGTQGNTILVPRPETSVSRSSLFTGARNEPSMVSELQHEILTSNRVDMLVSFIKWSGLRLLMEELREFTKVGNLRIITTSYMGATDIKAIDELRELPNTEIRVSYDTHRTRLHAKSYIFHRDTGFSTAYIGSSNLSNAALSSGLEWNVKVTATDMPETFEKIQATFEGYWNDAEFVPYSGEERPTLIRALHAERSSSTADSTFLFDITPYGFQREILEKLQAEREIRGHYRNLIVAATGTGKTVISAFDYKRFVSAHRSQTNRLLFVAHREEILRQSLDCFRAVLRDQNFGELFVGGHEPSRLHHLFISIQTLNSRNLTSHTPPDFYDFIVIDEFHHAAASSYQALLNYYQPKVLLGLTATPERLDGKDVTDYFDNRIAAEIRLHEAIDRGLLAPFQYFGVSDSVDLSTLHWRRGGYDQSELSNVYTGNRLRADIIVRSLRKYVTNVDDVMGLGFCVSVDHARFMSDFMNQHGIPSLALHANSPDQDRLEAKQRLVRGDIKFIFVVDLYNEGVDIPEVNTVLFLRPTESLTVFLQQLGRGLRLSEGKECLTVLDFIGQSHKKYRFEDKFRALLGKTRKPIDRQISDGFLDLPRGSFIQLEKQAKEYILENIRQAIGTRNATVRQLETFIDDTGKELTLRNFVDYYHLTMREFYRSGVSFARLCVRARLRDDFANEDESTISKALPRIASINSRRLISFLLHYLEQVAEQHPTSALWSNRFSEADKQMLLMFHYTVWQKPLRDVGFQSLEASIERITRNSELLSEIREVLAYNLDHIDFVDESVNLGFDHALDLHCEYSRDQILTALGSYTEDAKPDMREGVKYFEDKQLDIFLITLNKSDKDYSPTTMYQDYAINDVLFHWQSQSTTSAESPTGQRYIHHRSRGSRVALFVREYKEDSSGALPYTFLGTADYVSHEGSRPMSITWRLHRPMPAKMMKVTNRLIVS